jgi:hypothetical protein
VPDRAGDVHVCPFGMTMRRLPDGASVGQGAPGRWVGRRFPTIKAMHAALDRLREAGLDDETILAHLPVNPVADAATLAEAARELVGAQVIPLVAPGAPATETRRPRRSHEPREASEIVSAPTPAGPILEYVLQLQRLLATADRPEKACELLLKSVGAAVPLEASVILLRSALPGDGVAAAAPVVAASRSARAALASALAACPLGAAVLAEGRPLIESPGHPEAIEAFPGTLAPGAIVALPIAAGGRPALGAWVARVAAGRAGDHAEDAARLLLLLAELLGSRLEQLRQIPATAGPVEAPAARRPGPVPVYSVPTWSREDLLEALRSEVARAQRHQEFFLLADLRLKSSRQGTRLPVATMARALRASLRPYDRLALADDAPAGEQWLIVLTHLAPEAMEAALARARMLVEDILDASGGVEERGIRIGLGASAFGSDAVEPERMADHAGRAACRALDMAAPSSAIFHDAHDRAAV